MKIVGLQDVSDELIAGLRADYPSGTCAETATAQAIRERFSSFGIEAARAGAASKKAMSAGVAALQDLFDRTGGQGGDPATALCCRHRPCRAVLRVSRGHGRQRRRKWRHRSTTSLACRLASYQPLCDC